MFSSCSPVLAVLDWILNTYKSAVLLVEYTDRLSEAQSGVASEENNFMGRRPGAAVNKCLEVFLDYLLYNDYSILKKIMQ